MGHLPYGCLETDTRADHMSDHPDASPLSTAVFEAYCSQESAGRSTSWNSHACVSPAPQKLLRGGQCDAALDKPMHDATPSGAQRPASAVHTPVVPPGGAQYTRNHHPQAPQNSLPRPPGAATEGCRRPPPSRLPCAQKPPVRPRARGIMSLTNPRGVCRLSRPYATEHQMRLL